jgi:hypothetical protein
MSSDLTPDDAVRAIQAMTHVLETNLTRLNDLHASSAQWHARSERWMRGHGRLLALVFLLTGGMLCASVWMFVVGVRTHAVQTDALRQVMQENRAIFERLQR